mmetsp:Transcript_8566/g.21436  ORF Transcript_8566/g.21436 Transcript_8566/m.21436 type:complete len:669 (+) Transcript_8566:40-2046(+)
MTTTMNTTATTNADTATGAVDTDAAIDDTGVTTATDNQHQALDDEDDGQQEQGQQPREERKVPVEEETDALDIVHDDNNHHHALEEDDDDDGHGHGHGHDSGIVFYCRPSQRQKWGEPQSLPHTDWNATFMDLFYVAAAYNLGTLIRSDTSSTGILYFVGLFYPIMLVWNTKMYYDSRFCIRHDDMFHKLYEFAVLIALGTAVLYIRPVPILQNPNNIDLFVYTLCTTICHMLAIGRIIEVLVNVEGQPSAKSSAKRDLKYYSLSLVFYLAATIFSGIATDSVGSNGYQSIIDSGSEYNSTSSSSSSSSSYGGYQNETKGDDYDGDHRELAGSTTYTDSDTVSFDPRQQDITVWLLFAGSLSFQVMVGLMVLRLPKDGSHKSISIPMNIDFCFHRYGAWIMLMLGESVLSLLIVVAPDTSDYYKTFFSGILSITLLEYLHFRSQPYDADDHAMRRSKDAGIMFGYLMLIYSAALVVLGTCYKMLLYELVYSSDYEDSDSSGQRRRRSLLLAVFERVLAGSGGDASGLQHDDRQQSIADLFGGSMAIVFACSDLMILTHRGIASNYQCSCKDKHKSLPVRILAVVLIVVRVGMIGFTASLGQWMTDPPTLSFIGLCSILFQVSLRFAGTALYGPVFKSDDDDDNNGENVWPNVTRPMVEQSTEQPNTKS